MGKFVEHYVYFVLTVMRVQLQYALCQLKKAWQKVNAGD